MINGIKYRVWCKGKSKNLNFIAPRWISPYDFILNKYYPHPLDFPEDIVSVQFVGLLDKNGKEIYEGDIVKCKGYDGWFDKEGFYYNMEARFIKTKQGDCDSIQCIIPTDREIVGNMFEHPERLKSKYE